jgi:hypothetical protein
MAEVKNSHSKRWLQKDEASMTHSTPDGRKALAEIVAGLDGVTEFAKEVLRVAFDGGSLDGGDIQDMGIRHGLLAETKFDPLVHRDTNGYAEAGDEWFVFAGPLAVDQSAEITTLKRERDEAVAALESIRLYANDTLSGRADGGPDDRAWQREAVIECRNRARTALSNIKGEKQ